MEETLARLKELHAKLEHEGLTENEQAEINLLYSMQLLALYEHNQKTLQRLQR